MAMSASGRRGARRSAEAFEYVQQPEKAGLGHADSGGGADLMATTATDAARAVQRRTAFPGNEREGVNRAGLHAFTATDAGLG